MPVFSLRAGEIRAGVQKYLNGGEPGKKWYFKAMIRSDFIRALIGGSLPAFLDRFSLEAPLPPLQPPFLKAGSRIGIPAPAGYMFAQELRPAMELLSSWGFVPVPGNSLNRQWGNMGAPDDIRMADFQQMLDAPDLDAILCARGGYGFVRIIDRLNFSRFNKKPKWIIGFSDATVIHAHLSRISGIASIHAKMCNSFPTDFATADPVVKETLIAFRNMLSGESMLLKTASSPFNINGEARGILIGGNLSVLVQLLGSNSFPDTRGKILFLEDAGEYLYHFDRMFWALERSGVLRQIRGLLIGGFRIKPSENRAEEFPLSIEQIVLEKVKNYGYPVAFDFPTGHQKNNFPLKSGAMVEMKVEEKGVLVREIIP